MKKLKLIKKFGMYQAGETLEANELLEKHLIKGGFIAKSEKAEKVAKK